MILIVVYAENHLVVSVQEFILLGGVIVGILFLTLSNSLRSITLCSSFTNNIHELLGKMYLVTLFWYFFSQPIQD